MAERFSSRLADVIRRPLITEKATRALEQNQYTFEVDHRAAKPDIKAAVEQLFDVKVIGISTMNPPSPLQAGGPLRRQTCPSEESSGAPRRRQCHPAVP